MGEVATIGLDIAKSVFQVHGVDAAGGVVIRRQARRAHLLRFFAKLPRGRPIVAWSHGTTGTVESCGTSQNLDPAQRLNQDFLPGGTSWMDFGVPAIEKWLKEGYVTIAMDYQ